MSFARAAKPSLEEILPYDYCILVLGSTGCGKSTFINTFINVVQNKKPGDFITAIESTYYPETHQDFILDPVREELTSGLSHTKTVHYYKLSSDLTNNKTILLVDTPGLGAAEGIQQDDSFIENIIDSVRNHPTINAILVLERSSTNRITAYVDYCLY